MDSRHDASAEGRSPLPTEAATQLMGLIKRLFRDMHRPEEPVGPSSTDPSIESPKIEIGTADGLRKLAAVAPARRKQEQKATREQDALAEKRRIKALLQAHLQDAMWDELLSHLQPAAERGDTEFQLLRFPSGLCTDGGRKIRIGDEAWQDTLQGEASEVTARWKCDLEPKGIGLSARMLDYSNGMPGDIGLFATWRG